MNTEKNSQRIPQVDQATYVNLLSKFNESGPYYTSYPALSSWTNDFQHEDYIESLKDFFKKEGSDVPVHLYVHIPFCAKLCWYCICNMTVSNDRGKIQEFLNYLLREIDMLKSFFDANAIRPNIREIHLGGGTPSHLANDQFEQLTDSLSTFCDLKALDEFAMEIDPRTTNRDGLRFYASKGVQRISFGVQDFDLDVQKAINRVQPYELVRELLSPDIRELFMGFNFDLLFGLPKQTRDTFRNTLRLVEELSPERISLLKYAHIPNVRKHMKLIKDSELPPAEDLPLMYTESVQTLLNQGYEWIGIDYFAKPTDDLGKAVRNRTVWRNFNGFTPGRTNHLIGVGPTTTCGFGEYYSQSFFEFHDYFKAIDEGKFPILRGYKMSQDDVIRRDVMFQLLCDQTVDLRVLSEKYQIDASTYFGSELQALKDEFVDNGVLSITNQAIHVTTLGRFFLRNICKIFDTFNRDKDYRIPGPVLSRNRSLM